MGAGLAAFLAGRCPRNHTIAAPRPWGRGWGWGLKDSIKVLDHLMARRATGSVRLAREGSDLLWDLRVLRRLLPILGKRRAGSASR